MARVYFCAYHDMLDQHKGLKDSEFGRLMRAALRYSATGETPAQSYLKGPEASHWPGVQIEIDKQIEAYETKCRKNAENIRRRWAKKQPADADGAGAAILYDRIRPNTNELIKYKNNNTPLTPQGEAGGAGAMYNAGIAQAAQCWQQNIGVLSPAVGQQLAEWVQLAEPGMVCAAIEYAALAGKHDGRYIGSVIRNAASRNVTTLEAWQAEQRQRQSKNAPAGEKEEVKRRWL